MTHVFQTDNNKTAKTFIERNIRTVCVQPSLSSQQSTRRDIRRIHHLVIVPILRGCGGTPSRPDIRGMIIKRRDYQTSDKTGADKGIKLVYL